MAPMGSRYRHSRGTLVPPSAPPLYKMTPALDPKQGKMDQPGKNPVPNTSNSAPVDEKLMSGIGFYPRGFVQLEFWLYD